jgi:hypothetical protein
MESVAATVFPFSFPWSGRQAWHIDIVGTRNFWVFQDSSHLSGPSSFHHKTLLLLFATRSILYPLLFITDTTFNTRSSASYNPHITTLWWVTDKVHNYMD